MRIDRRMNLQAGAKLKHAKVTAKQPLRIGDRDQRHTHPPYWVLAVIDRGEDGIARVRGAFARYAYNKDELVPLDNHYERRTLEQLLSRRANGFGKRRNGYADEAIVRL
ncbi:hypothetical protein FCJ61_35570 [Burkholderia metallica]|uniref:hypothetical protein n=1 Tax=Burkholderia metallica TaxID=488729 RepID=UPI00157B0CBA|nr:hypothetical protein [Burkholderia metallica]NTZ88167.1 hypothetical protein [Burkholderia metallica]